MNFDDITKRFPRASASFIRANIQPDPAQPPPAKLECGKPDELAVPAQAHQSHTGRFLVRIESVRKRLLDEDRLCEVGVVDCCRYAGIIPGDSPAQARIETTQRKARKGEAEQTEITVYAIP